MWDIELIQNLLDTNLNLLTLAGIGTGSSFAVVVVVVVIGVEDAVCEPLWVLDTYQYCYTVFKEYACIVIILSACHFVLIY